MKKINILMVASVFFPDVTGGSGRYLYNLAKGLVERGYSVYILTRRRGKLPKVEKSEGINVYRINGAKIDKVINPIQCILNIQKTFNDLSRKISFNLIVFHQPFLALGIILLRKSGQIPKVYFFYSPWHEEFEIKKGLRKSNFASSQGHLKLLIYKLLSLFMFLIERFVLSRCERIIVLSSYSKKKVQAIHNIKMEKIEIIPGGVDIDKFRLDENKDIIRRELNIPCDKFILFTLRNLVPRMGLEDLIIAMEDIAKVQRGVYLVIGGEGFLREKLKVLAKKLNLESIISFTGHISEEKLPLYYQAADLFILPSKYLEGFGLVTLEALASGTPVLGTPVGGTVEMLSKFDKSYLFSGSDARALSKRILQFIKDKDNQLDLSIRCRNFVLNEYSWDKTINRMEKLIFEII